MGCVMLLMDERRPPPAEGTRSWCRRWQAGQTNGGIIPKTRGAFGFAGTLLILHRLCSRQRWALPWPIAQ